MLTKEQVNTIKKEFAGEKDRTPVILGALCDPGRFGVFRLLIAHHGMCVTDVARVFDTTVSAASQQLRVLEMVELVQKKRMGQMVCYELKKDNPIIKPLIQFIKSNKK